MKVLFAYFFLFLISFSPFLQFGASQNTSKLELEINSSQPNFKVQFTSVLPKSNLCVLAEVEEEEDDKRRKAQISFTPYLFNHSWCHFGDEIPVQDEHIRYFRYCHHPKLFLIFGVFRI